MLTEQQITDQQEFERKCITGGLEKLRSNTQNLEGKTYCSATIYGSACVNSILPNLIAYIDDKKENAKKQGAHLGAIVNKNLIPVASDLQSLLTCKVVFDHVFSSQRNKHSCTTIALAVGAAKAIVVQLCLFLCDEKT
jgi:hypothetical protein